MDNRAAMLFGLVLLSALAVVHTRHQFRQTFVELQENYQQRDSLNAEWSQLLLEQSTWSFHHLVEKNAVKRLGMTTPDPTAIQVVTER